MTEPTEGQHPGAGDDRENAASAGYDRADAARDAGGSKPFTSPQQAAPQYGARQDGAPQHASPQHAPLQGSGQQPHGQPASAPSYGVPGPSQHGQPTHGAHYAAPGAQPMAHHAAPNAASHDASGPASGTRRSPIPIVAALAVGALIGGVSGATVAMVADNGAGGTTIVGSQSPGTITINDSEGVAPVSAVAAKAGPSVVTISVGSSQGAGTGSGVVIDDDGHIITNTHVVTLDGASGDPTISVRTWDGRVLDATLIGTDPLSDLAVIKVDDADLPAIDFADSSELNVGDVAIAIGAPLGLANTVTDGIVSALNRSITVASSAAPEQPEQDQPEQPDNPFDFWRFDVPGQEQSNTRSTVQLSVLQTDAAINPGNSGGALLNAQGELIGINVAIASAGSSGQGSAGSIGVGFAIPSNLAERIADEIIANGEATHGLLGAMVTQSSGGILGAEIAEVSPGGAAEAAGLRAGDVVTYLGETPITSPNDLTAHVRALPAGAETTITFVRSGDVRTEDVTLGTLE